MATNRITEDETRIVALVKGAERYVWLYHESRKCEALKSFGRFASDPELSFTWYDAACLSQRVSQHSC